MAAVVFDAAFDPDLPFIHRKVWFTDVHVAHDRSKQLICLRESPNEVVEFSVSGITGRDMAHVDHLLQQGVPDGFWVPMWRDRVPLGATLAAGSVVVPVDTTGRTFTAGDHLLLWTSPYNWETVPIAGVDATSVVLDGPTGSEWGRHCLAVPLRLGYLPAAMTPNRLGRDAQSTLVRFVLPATLTTSVSEAEIPGSTIFIEEGYYLVVLVIFAQATGNPETLRVSGALNGTIASAAANDLNGYLGDLPGTVAVFGPAPEGGYLYFTAEHHESGVGPPGRAEVLSLIPGEYQLGLEDPFGDLDYNDIILRVWITPNLEFTGVTLGKIAVSATGTVT